MENSELRKRTISLGKALVEELKLNPGVDTLSRWMAHYVADQLTIAENATGDKKRVAEQRCFETILKLWQHRSHFSRGHRPFESFEPIFNALARLDPDNPQPYYFSPLGANSSYPNEVSKESDEVLHWINLANDLDRGARILIEFIFHQAAQMAVDEKVANWLFNAVNIPPGDDISIIIHLMQNNEGTEEESNKDENTQGKKLLSRIKQLDEFIVLSQEIRSLLITQIKTAN